MDDQTPVYFLAFLSIQNMASLQTDYVGPLKAINERQGVAAVVATPMT